MMQSDLEKVHKLLGEVCGGICIALTIWRITGGRSAVKRWRNLTREALEILDNMLPDEK